MSNYSMNVTGPSFRGGNLAVCMREIANNKLIQKTAAVAVATAAASGIALSNKMKKADSVHNEVDFLRSPYPLPTIGQDLLYRPFNTAVTVPGSFIQRDYKKDFKEFTEMTRNELIELATKKTKNLPEKVQKLEKRLQKKGYDIKEEVLVNKHTDEEEKITYYLDKETGEILKKESDKSFIKYYYIYDDKGNLSKRVTINSIAMYTYNDDNELTGSFKAYDGGILTKYVSVACYGKNGARLNFEFDSNDKKVRTNIASIYETPEDSIEKKMFDEGYALVSKSDTEALFEKVENDGTVYFKKHSVQDGKLGKETAYGVKQYDVSIQTTIDENGKASTKFINTRSPEKSCDLKTVTKPETMADLIKMHAFGFKGFEKYGTTPKEIYNNYLAHLYATPDNEVDREICLKFGSYWPAGKSDSEQSYLDNGYELTEITSNHLVYSKKLKDFTKQVEVPLKGTAALFGSSRVLCGNGATGQYTYNSYTDEIKYDGNIIVPVRRYKITDNSIGKTKICTVLCNGQMDREISKYLHTGDLSLIDFSNPRYLDSPEIEDELKTAAREQAKEKLRELIPECDEVYSRGYDLGSEYNRFGARTPGTINLPPTYEDKYHELAERIRVLSQRFDIYHHIYNRNGTYKLYD